MVSLGGALQGIGAVITGVSAISAGRENQKQANEIAEREEERTKIEVQRHKRNVSEVLARNRVAFSSASLRHDAGSALDLLADNLRQAELDEELIKAGGEINASAARSAGDEAARRGRQVAGGAVLTAIGQLAEDSF